MKKLLITTLMLVATAATLQAQDLIVGGRQIRAPFWDTGRLMGFSQTDAIYGTSRSAAMGGAFTSLGADLSSMNINPAGLGMYQGSDWGVTMSLAIDKMNTSAPNADMSQGGSRTSFGLGNLGVSYNVYNSSGALTSLSIGFAYNRAANFNSRTGINTYGERASVVEMFQNQLNLIERTSDVTPTDLDPAHKPFYSDRFYLDEWGAILGYQTGLLGHDDLGYFGFNGSTPNDSYYGAVTRGGIYEYSFALGANVSNKLYLGATLGITEINYKEETSYEEYYYEGSPIASMWWDNTTRITGAGFTAKFGAVYRPVPAIRLGAAFHLPTFYTIDKSYHGAMGCFENGEEYVATTQDPLVDQQHFNTPPKLLLGASAILGGRAIVAVDWEMAWYNKIRARGDDFGYVDDTKADSEFFYKPGHTIRVGLEHSGDIFSIRAGGSYMFDIMKEGNLGEYQNATSNPTPRSGYSLTAGLGFNVGRNGYVDLAYVYNNTKWTPYDFYYFQDSDVIVSQYDTVGGEDISRVYTPHRKHHGISLTIGSRF